MTQKNSKANPSDARLEDLLLLHRYARTRPEDGKMSARAFGRAEGMPEGRLKDSVRRIEAALDAYVLVKRVNGGDGADIVAPEQLLAIKSTDGRPVEVANRNRLTLAGEIAAELASILAGYLHIARAALGTRKRRPDEHDMRMGLAWLRAERRRVHDMVMEFRTPGVLVEHLGNRLPDTAFEDDPRDSVDMLVHPIPPAVDPDEDARVS